MKSDAQYKRDQRVRDKLILEDIGFNSLEGVMKQIRGLDENGLKRLRAVLFGRIAPTTKAKDKAGTKATSSRTGKGQSHRANLTSHKTQDRRKG